MSAKVIIEDQLVLHLDFAFVPSLKLHSAFDSVDFRFFFWLTMQYVSWQHCHDKTLVKKSRLAAQKMVE